MRTYGSSDSRQDIPQFITDNTQAISGWRPISAVRRLVPNVFRHGLQDGCLSWKPHVEGGTFPETPSARKIDCGNWNWNQLLLHVSPVISPAQHGFLPRRSCTTNLACLVKQLWDSIADGLQTDVIYTDYSSAFTSVNHYLLLHKLHHSYQLSSVWSCP